jgi:hypothetical protein
MMLQLITRLAACPSWWSHGVWVFLDWESEARYACIQMSSMQVGEVILFEINLCYI